MFSNNRNTRDDPRCLTNINKGKKEIVLKAIDESGLPIEWHDTPSEKMPASMAADYGSIWTREPTRDASPFWRAYERIDATLPP